MKINLDVKAINEWGENGGKTGFLVIKNGEGNNKTITIEKSNTGTGIVGRLYYFFANLFTSNSSSIKKTFEEINANKQDLKKDLSQLNAEARSLIAKKVWSNLSSTILEAPILNEEKIQPLKEIEDIFNVNILANPHDSINSHGQVSNLWKARFQDNSNKLP